ncbi:nitrilase-related carbon-nitrogen hydrolase [Arthrobacter globiformis]|uniref:nitrilase-related carbon-nitrogen hydrolase n=1 Tax=Arthrobacter globiformis TaxID=1665 RepID=UPI0027D85C41|nr:nitrilase-related carbon-nitrogen hydrolase [Arthrobacter globiformis]
MYEKKIVDASFPAVAEPLDGPVCRELAATAARHGIRLVAGVVETSEQENRAYNTLVAFGPEDGRLAVYRKIHLFDAQGFGESTYITPGPSTEPVVFVAGGSGVRPDDLRSLLVDPMEYVEVDFGLEPGVRAAEVSLGTVARVKEQFPMFRQRRRG